VQARKVPGINTPLLQAGKLFKRSKDGRRGVGGCPLSYPCQRDASTGSLREEQMIEQSVAGIRQKRNKATKGLLLGVIPGCCDQTLQPCHPWTNELLPVKFFTCQLK
jgi:hypothetical protein